MSMRFGWCLVFGVLCIGITISKSAVAAEANRPTPAQALALSPVQDDVDYDRPQGPAIARCKVEPEGPKGQSGWVVKNDQGQILRRFLDSNGDNKVDQWCYFKDGVEVYRDIDSNANGKADQSRWFGAAGTRWGVDKNEDGRIDYWKVISAEEVTMEAVAALRTHDPERLKRLMLLPAELKELGLGEKLSERIAQKISAATTSITQVAAKKDLLSDKAQWLHFVAATPGVVPAGTQGSTRDVTAYQNVAAIVKEGDKTLQLKLGTLIKVGEAWRMVDLPEDRDPTALFQENLALASTGSPSAEGNDKLSETAQKLVKMLETIDKQLAEAPPAQAAKLQETRADTFEKLIAAVTSSEEKANFTRQLADSISAAVQASSYPEGTARLLALSDKLAKAEAKGELTAYVRFRYLQASYAQGMAAAKSDDFPKVQEKWLKDLEKFVSEFPTSPDAAEAMLQLAVAQEFSGKDEDARKLYHRITVEFGGTPLAAKAAGAKLRLECEGKPIKLKGTSLDGKAVDLARYEGKIVVIHYWATWCQPCKQDMDTIARLQTKFGKQGLEVIGVNLDADKTDAQRYLADNRLPWAHLYEPGGLESRLAMEMGIVTLPTMLLVDKDGKVADRNIHAADLETEFNKRFSGK